MNQICQQLFTGARLTLNQHGSLGVGHAEGQLDSAANSRRLPDDPILAVAFVQGAFEPHHFSGKLVAFQRRAYLIGNALDQRYFMILESVTRFAPDQSQQAKSVPANTHWSDQRRPTA